MSWQAEGGQRPVHEREQDSAVRLGPADPASTAMRVNRVGLGSGDCAQLTALFELTGYMGKPAFSRKVIS